MLRLPVWFISALGASIVLAVSCSPGDDATPAPGAVGGESDGGASDANPGGNRDDVGTAGAAAGDRSIDSGHGGAPAGGAGASELTDEWQSGTRLRAVLEVAGDAKRFKTWHDSELDVDCAFSPDSNKVERC